MKTTRKTNTLKGRKCYTYHCKNENTTQKLEILAHEAGMSIEAYLNGVIEEKAKESKNFSSLLEEQEIKRLQKEYITTSIRMNKYLLKQFKLYCIETYGKERQMSVLISDLLTDYLVKEGYIKSFKENK